MMTPLEARLTEEVAVLRARNQEQEIVIKVLREKVDLLVRKVFGKSSEALDENQLMLLLEEGEGAKKAEASDGGMDALEAEIAAEGKAERQRFMAHSCPPLRSTEAWLGVRGFPEVL